MADADAPSTAAPDAQAAPTALASPPAAVAASPLLAPEAEEARPKLVKALHGTLLQTHINAPAKQQAAVDALLKMVQARSQRVMSHAPLRCTADADSCAWLTRVHALSSHQNVLREPATEKFRRVRCGNEAFRSRVAAVKGGEEFLRAAGWRDVTIDFERHLVLEPHASLECVAVHANAKAGPWRCAERRASSAQGAGARGPAAAEGAGRGDRESRGARPSAHAKRSVIKTCPRLRLH
jgi:hypothetical protein